MNDESNAPPSDDRDRPRDPALTALLRRHPLRCPAAFIGGRSSAEMRQVGMALTERITRGRTMMLDGSHLFPMEQPVATAAAIEAALLNLAALTPLQR